MIFALYDFGQTLFRLFNQITVENYFLKTLFIGIGADDSVFYFGQPDCATHSQIRLPHVPGVSVHFKFPFARRVQLSRS